MFIIFFSSDCSLLLKKTFWWLWKQIFIWYDIPSGSIFIIFFVLGSGTTTLNNLEQGEASQRGSVAWQFVKLRQNQTLSRCLENAILCRIENYVEMRFVVWRGRLKKCEFQEIRSTEEALGWSTDFLDFYFQKFLQFERLSSCLLFIRGFCQNTQWATADLGEQNERNPIVTTNIEKIARSATGFWFLLVLCWMRSRDQMTSLTESNDFTVVAQNVICEELRTFRWCKFESFNDRNE